jgi:hypothetical protein
MIRENTRKQAIEPWEAAMLTDFPMPDTRRLGRINWWGMCAFGCIVTCLLTALWLGWHLGSFVWRVLWG